MKDSSPWEQSSSYFMDQKVNKKKASQNMHFTNNTYFSREGGVLNLHSNREWHVNVDINSPKVWMFRSKLHIITLMDHTFCQHLSSEMLQNIYSEHTSWIIRQCTLSYPHNNIAPTQCTYWHLKFPNIGIGENGTFSWPARSPYRSSLDFCYWGYIRSLIYTHLSNQRRIS